eukprot:CAMPEP_0176318722 /NCGR_PEP_ID=MMETSP0121_2-20121125/69926_1 /TAXON_ID=160619 /ORGANISM="Kryptoperidinium foliaceum, Strain CCMP 1326" /LENGTH=68 /DNA_ID=CAMNT_0017661035 /DNA_START=193 /DNA_END=396 /DNA_ORIENTATION=+
MARFRYPALAVAVVPACQHLAIAPQQYCVPATCCDLAIRQLPLELRDVALPIAVVPAGDGAAVAPQEH